jgi:hypothetical protein
LSLPEASEETPTRADSPIAVLRTELVAYCNVWYPNAVFEEPLVIMESARRPSDVLDAVDDAVMNGAPANITSVDDAFGDVDAKLKIPVELMSEK